MININITSLYSYCFAVCYREIFSSGKIFLKKDLTNAIKLYTI